MWGLLSIDILLGKSKCQTMHRGAAHERAGPAVSLAQINNFIGAFVDIDTQLLGNMFTAQ